MHIESRSPFRLVAGSAAPNEPYQADVIILALNRCQETIEAVTSAMRQTGINLYIAVLDQGSSEETQSRFAKEFAHSPRLGYFVSEENFGVGGGRNLAAAIGHGQMIVGLDNDAVLADQTVLARAYEIFQKEQALGALAFGVFRHDGKGVDLSSWGYSKSFLVQSGGQFGTTTYVGAGHALRRSAWIQAGGYDASLFFTWEEYDFCLRVIALGWSVRYEGSLGVLHKASTEARVTWSGMRTKLFVRNRLIIARKWNASWVALMPRIFYYLLKALYYRRLGPTVDGIMAAIRADKLLAKRPLPDSLRHYLRLHERPHRLRLFDRLRFTVL
jgi:GT2 family glycosyltransferase